MLLLPSDCTVQTVQTVLCVGTDRIVTCEVFLVLVSYAVAESPCPPVQHPATVRRHGPLEQYALCIRRYRGCDLLSFRQ